MAHSIIESATVGTASGSVEAVTIRGSGGWRRWAAIAAIGVAALFLGSAVGAVAGTSLPSRSGLGSAVPTPSPARSAAETGGAASGTARAISRIVPTVRTAPTSCGSFACDTQTLIAPQAGVTAGLTDTCSPSSLQISTTTFAGKTTLSSSNGASGVADLYYNVTFSASLQVCYEFNPDFIGLPSTSVWVNFTESYSESIVLNISVAGPGAFELDNLNGPPIALVSIPIVPTEAICCGPVPIVWFGVNLDLGLEYAMEFDQGSWINATEGSGGTLEQDYDFASGQWIEPPNSVTCLYGLSSSDACTSIVTSPSFGGAVILRIGPEVAVNLSVGIDILTVAAVQVDAFLYGQASLYYGIGASGYSASDESGGACGTGNSVDGLPPASVYAALGSAFGSDWWGALCAGVGFQFQAQFSAGCYNVFGFSGCLFTTNIFPVQTVAFYDAPLAATLVACDFDQHECAPTFTNAVPVQSPDSFVMTEKESDYLLIGSPLDNPWGPAGIPNLGMTWSTPIVAGSAGTACGSLAGYAAGYPYFNEFTAPNFATTCQLTVTSSLPIDDDSFQVSVVTFDIKVVAPTISIGHTTTFVPYCTTHFTCGALEYASGSWSVALTPFGGGTSRSVSGSSLDDLSVTNLTNGTYTYQITPPRGVTVGPLNGTIFVNGSDSWMVEFYTPLVSEFVESGLPSGSVWGIAIDGLNGTATVGNGTSAIDVTTTDGTFAYTVLPPAGYSVPPSDSGVVTVNGTGTVVTLPFSHSSAGSPPYLAEYPVKFRPVGLPPDTSWTLYLSPGVVLSGEGTVGLSLLNGTYSYSAVGGAGANWTRSVSMGEAKLTVAGVAIVKNITFAAVTYPVTFVETGLASATAWTVSLDGTPHHVFRNVLTLALANGTYGYEIPAVTGYHLLTAAENEVYVTGAGVVIDVPFALTSYAIALNASGLEAGKTFSATVGGVTHTIVATGTYEFLIWWGDIGNGSYPYTVAHVAGYTETPRAGTLHVRGSSVQLNVTFSGIGYSVVFNETGLPAGATWTVTIGNASVTTNATSLNFTLPDGTYWFNVTSDKVRYGASPEEGKFTVDDQGVSMVITFQRTPFPTGSPRLAPTEPATGSPAAVRVGSGSGRPTGARPTPGVA